MRALTAGLRAVGLCVSRRLPSRAPAVVQRPGVVGPEGLIPRPDRLVRDGDPAFGEQILDVAEAPAKADTEPKPVVKRKSHLAHAVHGAVRTDKHPREKAPPPADKEARKRVLLRLPPKLHWQLRQLSLDENTSLQVLGLEALKRILEERQREGRARHDSVAMADFVVSDAITDLEQQFPVKDLLALDYFQKYRHSYYRCHNEGRQIPPRNYYKLLQFLADIHEYRPDDAQTFVKAFRTRAEDWRNSEATFAEVIVYRHYVRLVYEKIIRAVRHGRKECDIIVDRLDGSTAFLEVFSIMPNRREIGVNDITTHTQDAMASVRQKLLRKIRKQNQMTKTRDNYAVIELNDVSITGSFAVLSSLSSGYKVTIDRTTMKTVNSGYDWSHSVFEDESLRHLKAVIFFDSGNYESRHFLDNPLFVPPPQHS